MQIAAAQLVWLVASPSFLLAQSLTRHSLSFLLNGWKGSSANWNAPAGTGWYAEMPAAPPAAAVAAVDSTSAAGTGPQPLWSMIGGRLK